MSRNDVLDVGLESNAIDTSAVLEESVYENFSSEKTVSVNPYKFSDRHLLDKNKGLDDLSNKVQKTMQRIGKKKKNNDVFDEIVKTYRLWAHHINPKYRLKDTITLVNKVGKSREVTEYRRKMIDEDNLSKLRHIEDTNRPDAADSTQKQALFSLSGDTLMNRGENGEQLMISETEKNVASDRSDSFISEQSTKTTLKRTHEYMVEKNQNHITKNNINSAYQSNDSPLQEKQIDEFAQMMQAEADFYEQSMQ
ncbi:hypothetical protein QEN19_002754 [Hanseniaspora menglaensis]